MVRQWRGNRTTVSCYSSVNKDEYMIYYAYTSVQSVITSDRLGRCFRFVYIYAGISLRFLYRYSFSVNKDL